MPGYGDKDFVYLDPIDIFDTNGSNKDVTFALRFKPEKQIRRDDVPKGTKQMHYIATYESNENILNRNSKKKKLGKNKISKIYEYISYKEDPNDTLAHKVLENPIWKATNKYVSWMENIVNYDEWKNWLIFTTSGMDMENSLHILDLNTKQEIANYSFGTEVIVSTVLVPFSESFEICVFVQVFDKITLQPYLMLFNIDSCTGCFQLLQKFDPFQKISSDKEKNSNNKNIKTISKFQFVDRIGEYDIFAVVGLYEIIFIKFSSFPISKRKHSTIYQDNQMCHILGVMKNTDFDFEDPVKSSLNFSTFDIMHLHPGIFDLSLTIVFSTKTISNCAEIFQVTLNLDQMYGLRKLTERERNLLTESGYFSNHPLIKNYYHPFGSDKIIFGKRIFSISVILSKHQDFHNKSPSNNHDTLHNLQKSIPNVKTFYHQDHLYFFLNKALYFQDLQYIDYKQVPKHEQIRFCITLPT
ncbi:hypothetical protein ACO0QE_004231 [Hanseniaspora vineae]